MVNYASVDHLEGGRSVAVVAHADGEVSVISHGNGNRFAMVFSEDAAASPCRQLNAWLTKALEGEDG